MNFRKRCLKAKTKHLIRNLKRDTKFSRPFMDGWWYLIVNVVGSLLIGALIIFGISKSDVIMSRFGKLDIVWAVAFVAVPLAFFATYISVLIHYYELSKKFVLGITIRDLYKKAINPFDVSNTAIIYSIIGGITWVAALVQLDSPQMIYSALFVSVNLIYLTVIIAWKIKKSSADLYFKYATSSFNIRSRWHKKQKECYEKALEIVSKNRDDIDGVVSIVEEEFSEFSECMRAVYLSIISSDESSSFAKEVFLKFLKNTRKLALRESSVLIYVTAFYYAEKTIAHCLKKGDCAYVNLMQDELLLISVLIHKKTNNYIKAQQGKLKRVLDYLCNVDVIEGLGAVETMEALSIIIDETCKIEHLFLLLRLLNVSLKSISELCQSQSEVSKLHIVSLKIEGIFDTLISEIEILVDKYYGEETKTLKHKIENTKKLIEENVD